MGRPADQIARSVTFEEQAALRLEAKNRQLNGLRAEIKSGDTCPGGHSSARIPQASGVTPAQNVRFAKKSYRSELFSGVVLEVRIEVEFLLSEIDDRPILPENIHPK